MPKIDTLDALDDEQTLSTLWTHSEHTLNTLWTHFEHTLNIPWTYLKICPRFDKISKTLINQSVSNRDPRDASASKKDWYTGPSLCERPSRIEIKTRRRFFVHHFHHFQIVVITCFYNMPRSGIRIICIKKCHSRPFFCTKLAEERDD